MATVTIELDREVWNLVQPVYQPPKQVLTEIVVLELYRRREVSSGKAAELLGMERFEFVRYASRLGIPFFDMSEEELAEEILAAQNGS
jgi:predicted HTH domain antitoxin